MPLPPPDGDPLLGRLLVHLQLVSPEAVECALAEQARRVAAGAERPQLGQLLVEAGALSPSRVARMLELQGRTLAGATLLRPSQPLPAGAPPSAGPAVPPCGPTPARDAAPSSTPPPSDSGTPFGRYRLLDRLGAGGMGMVWKAWDTELGRIVALKEMRPETLAVPEDVERFRREAHLAARLRHPNIVAVHDVGQVGERHFLTMDYISGQTLAGRLEATRAAKRAGSPQGLDRLRAEVALLAQVAEAVAYAHAQGVVHRDLKPANVLVAPDDQAFVMDFGLAKEVERPDTQDAGDDARRRRSLTVTGQLMGTPAYMSPEQAHGHAASIGPPTDAWALGVMLYEVLTGETPFEREGDPWNVLCAVVVDDPVRPKARYRHVPEELEAVCLKALEKDLARRYRGAADFAADLRRWLQGEPVEARRPGPAWRAWRKAVRHRRVVAAAGVLAVGLAWAAAATWRAHGSEARLRALAERVEATVAGFEDTVMRVEMGPGARQELARQPLQSLDDLIDHDPGYGPYRSWRGELHRLLHDPKPAEADYDAGCALAPGEPIVWYLRGTYRIQRYVVSRGLPGAIQRTSGIEFAPLPAETPDERTWRTGALADLARIVAAGARDPRIGAERLDLGGAVLAIFGGGAQGYARALRLLEHPGSPRAWRARGLALYHSKQFTEAEAAFARTVAVWSQDDQAWCLGGLSALAAGLTGASRGQDPRAAYRRALDDSAAVLAHDAGNALAIINRGTAWLWLGRADAEHGQDPRAACGQAIADFSLLLARRAESVVAYNNRGNSYLYLGEADAARGQDPRASYDRALADYDAALRLDPGFADGYANRGLAWLRVGEAEAARGQDPQAACSRAITEFDAALARDPESASAHGQRGIAWLRLGEAQAARSQDARAAFGQAIAELDAAVGRNPGDADACNNRGSAYRCLGEAEAARGLDPRATYARAITDYDATLRLNPGHAVAYNNRGNAWLKLGEAQAARGQDPGKAYAQAEADYRGAIERRHAQAYLNLGTLYRLLRRFDEAIAAFERGARAAPGMAARAAAQIAETRRTRDAAAGATGPPPGPAADPWAAEFAHAEATLRTGDYGGARAGYERGLALLDATLAPLPEAERTRRLAEPALRAARFAAHYNLACLLALAAAGRNAPKGEPTPVAAEAAARLRDEAFAHLARAADLGRPDRAHLEADTDLGPLHADPRWEELLEKLPR